MKISYMILVVMFICMTTSTISANNLQISKIDFKQPIPKHHPGEQLLLSGKAPIVKHGRAANERLLVILVDFASENPDDPFTTGNGKFVLQADSSYHITIGAPPHDQTYFEANLYALRLYYLAASLGSYNLSYDVYPKNASAYTLHHTMGYFNPPNASSDVFLSRMEEYFKESFEIADSLSPEIDFSSYDHYMIVHAGSDWQHDIFGDTPSDMPSFFIHVAPGKEAIVDSTFTISHACNVPETITQDLQLSVSDSINYVSGYGALNGVFAHEFGHSMGLVDLYNVRTSQPEVGLFDIMDSGGGTQMIAQVEGNTLYLVDGGLPALPGAWSRVKMFEQDFRARHILEDSSDIGYGKRFQIKAAESRYTSTNPKPYFVKIPLSSTEYILLENRSVDPDGDGGTSLIGIDPNDPTNHQSNNKRVILAPSPYADNLYTPSYEYDYLLPSWQGSSSDRPAIGGGILAWHIDDKIIYQQGVTNQGEFTSNYDNNSVNAIHSKRGIRIIEADNLPDIGNQYSYFWTGTSYEYFFKNRPVLDSDGYFEKWSDLIWREKLSSDTQPALMTNENTPAPYTINFYSNPHNLMQIEIASNAWSELSTIGNSPNLAALGPIVAGDFYNTDMPVISQNNISYLTHEYEASQNIDQWSALYGSFDFSPGTINHPIIATDLNHNRIGDYSLVNGNKVSIFEGLAYSELVIPDSLITDEPLYVNNTYFIPGNEKLYTAQNPMGKTSLFGTSFSIPGAKLIADSTRVYALSNNELDILDLNTELGWSVSKQFDLPGAFTKYQLIGYKDLEYHQSNIVFLLNDYGDLYRLQNDDLHLILRVKDYTSVPATQLALGKFKDNEVCLLLAADNMIIALNLNGGIIPGFPVRFDHADFTSFEYPKLVTFGNTNFAMIPDNRGGYFTISEDGVYDDKYSYFWNTDSLPDYLHYENISERLYLYYSDSIGNINAAYMNSITSNPIIWNGYRNGTLGFYQGVDIPVQDSLSFNAYIYPNPISHGNARLHIDHLQFSTKVHVYDIQGKLMKELKVDKNNSTTAELLLNFKDWSSGVYLCTVESNQKIVRFKIAIEK